MLTNHGWMREDQRVENTATSSDAAKFLVAVCSDTFAGPQKRYCRPRWQRIGASPSAEISVASELKREREGVARTSFTPHATFLAPFGAIFGSNAFFELTRETGPVKVG